MPDLPRIAALLCLALAALTAPATGQVPPGNPVYVDDSPRAWELFRRAEAQTAENVGEAVRLYQELLDEYGSKLIPRHEATSDEFVAVRTRVLDALHRHPELLTRHRLMQTAEAERLLAQGELERLARTRPLTAPGLDALLQLAQESMELARFHAALAWLEPALTHPDLDERRAAHAWFMQGVAAHYLGDVDALRRALAALAEEERDYETCRDGLDALVADGPGPLIEHGITSLDEAPTDELTDLVGQTIWSRAYRRPTDFNETMPGRPRSTGKSNIAATVAGANVYVNDGFAVRALDRFTGRSVWERVYADSPRQFLADRTSNPNAGDLSLLAVEGDALVALTGQAFANARPSEGGVLCLDAGDGAYRWATSLDRIGGDDEYEGLFPHGAPIISEGRVYVLARRAKQMLTGCYVVALDLDTGRLEWIRHVASSGSKAQVARPFSTLVRDGRDLLVASPVGAVGCIDAPTGLTRWLRRSSVPVNVRTSGQQPWEMNGAVVAGDLVLAITPDQRQVLVLDRRSGDLVEAHDARSTDRWNGPSYLLSQGPLVFSIGQDIRAFDVGDLGAPRWRLPAPRTSDLGAPRTPVATSASGDFELVGRVQSVDGGLVVPTSDGLLLVDHQSGVVLHRLPIDASGNPVALGSQVVIAGNTGLDVYMSLERAEAMLRQRIAAAQLDPEPALSLLQLGVRVSDVRLALEGAGLALDVLRRAPGQHPSSVRNELFEKLLEIHRRAIAATPEDSEALYAMIGAVASSADQRVEYLLAYGEGLTERDPARAVETYQAILSEPVLAGTFRSEAALLRPAAQWAAQRIDAILTLRGRALYQPQADYARQILERLAETNPNDDDALAALAREFPFADASIDAALRAARQRVDRGQVRGAIGVLASIYHLAPQDARGRRLLGAMVELAEASDRRAVALALLDYAHDAHGGAPLLTSTGPRLIDDWRASLAPGARRAHPRLGIVPGAGTLIEGAQLVPHLPPVRDTPHDRTLLLVGDQLRLLVPGAPEEEWARRPTVNDRNVEILAFDGDEILLWLGAKERNDPQVICLDPATGRTRWTSDRVADHLAGPLQVNPMGVGQMPNGSAFDPGETLVEATDETVLFVQRTGGVLALDRTAGGAVRWAENGVMEEVHFAIGHPFGLVLVGRDRMFDPRTGSIEPVPRVAVIDLENGRLLGRYRPQGDVIWATVDPLGSLLCASEEGLELIDLLSGRRRWMNVSYEAMGTRRGTGAGTHAIVESRTSSLLSIGYEDGVLSPPFDIGVRGDWNDKALETVDVASDRIFARYHDRVVRYDVQGEVLGADVIEGQRSYLAMVHHDDGIVVLSQYDSRMHEGNGIRRQDRYCNLYFLSENCRIEGDVVGLPPLPRPIAAMQALDDFILISTTTDTIVLPVPAR